MLIPVVSGPCVVLAIQLRLVALLVVAIVAIAAILVASVPDCD